MTQQPNRLDKPLKILHVIDSGGLYGAEIMLLNLASEQVKLGLDPTIASIGNKHVPEKPIETEALRRGLKVQKFRFRNGPNFLGALKIRRSCKKGHFDIIHSHGYKPNILLGFMPGRLRGAPMLTTLHGWTSTSGDSKMSLYEWLDARSLKFMDAVVMVSQSMLNHPKLLNRSLMNIHVIQNGIPMNEGVSAHPPVFRDVPQLDDPTTQRPDDTMTRRHDDSTTQQTAPPLDQSIINFCMKGFTVGSVGRLSSEKGYKYLVEAIRLLRDQGVDANLLVIGEGIERKSLEDLATKLGLGENVLLPGYRSQASRYLEYFKIFVLSSLTEGLPIALLEAMRAKVPVVVTQVGGMPLVIQDSKTGLLIEPGNPEALCKALSTLYHDTEFSLKLTQSAFQEVSKSYLGESMAMRYRDVYYSLTH